MEFNSLPLEMQLKIFSYLSTISDVMKIRRVCKWWASLIDSASKFKKMKCLQKRPGELDVFEPNKFDFYLTSTRSFLDYTRNDLKFRRVKYLEANLALEYVQSENAFDFLNSFEFLDSVFWILDSVFFLFVVRSSDNQEEVQEKNFVVNLKHLKRISFNLYPGTYASKIGVLLDLPSLRYVGLNSPEQVTIGYPSRLLFLGIDGLFRGERFDYSKFTRLDTILTMASDVRSITASFVEKLPRLRKLNLSDVYEPLNYDLPTKLGSGAQIFYYGFEINLREISLGGEQLPATIDSLEPSEASTRFIAQNYRRSIRKNPFVKSVRYNTMVSELGDIDENEMLKVIAEHFPDLKHLHVSETVADPEKLLKFIDKLQTKRLTLERATLPASFFKKLVEGGSSIEWLIVKNEPTMNILDGDFDFIFKLKNLTKLEFQDSPLPLAFVAKVLNKFKKITYVGFEQPEKYKLRLYLTDKRQEIALAVEASNFLFYKVTHEEAPKLLNVLVDRLKADGSVCPKELQVLLRRLELEKETHQFMMRKYVYEQRHSIGLLSEQMGLFNLVG